MPIHRIHLPSQSTVSMNNLDEYFNPPVLSHTNSMPVHTIHSNNHTHTKSPSHSNDSLNLLKASTKNSLKFSNSSNSSSGVTLANAQSSSSLHSMLSNQTATTEYSPNLIDDECGDLLKIIDLDIDSDRSVPSQYTTDDEHQKIPYNGTLHEDLTSLNSSNLDVDDTDVHTLRDNIRAQFHLEDDESDDNDDGYFDSDIDHHHASMLSPLTKTTTSTDTCGCSHTIDDTITTVIPDYKDESKWNYKEKWAFVLIGLPACGKSTMIHDFMDYVNQNTDGKVRVDSYNAGEIRRAYELEGHHRFDFNDLKSSQKLRDFYAFEALKNLTDFLVNDKTDIGILDATNTTKVRREAIFDYIKKVSKETGVRINPLLLEVKCSNRALRRYNIEQKSKNKDYKAMPHDNAINDFLGRIYRYENSYEKVTIDEIQHLNVKYFGIDNVGDSIYYDCGLDHHDDTRHQNLTFNQIALDLLYRFLISYRTKYAGEYLTKVDEFYTGGHYKPITTHFSKPVSVDDVKNVQKEPSGTINSVVKHENDESNNRDDKVSHTKVQFPKVLSSSRIDLY